MVASPHLIRKGARMRSPHRDASAADRRGGPRPWRPALMLLAALASGCVTEQRPRLIDGEEALKEMGRQKSQASYPPSPAPAALPTDGNPAESSKAPIDPAVAAAGRPAPSTGSQHRVVIAAARAVPTAGEGIRGGTDDPQRQAGRRQGTGPRPAGHPAAFGGVPHRPGDGPATGRQGEPDHQPNADRDPRGAGTSVDRADAAGPLAQRRPELPRA